MTTTEQPTKTEAPRPRAAQPFATYTFSGTGPLPEFNEERARLEAWAAEAIESAYNRKEVDFAQLRRAQRLREEIARRWPGPQRVDPDWIRMMETRPDPRTDPEAIKDLAGDLESMLNDQATGSRIDLGELVEHFHRRCSEMGLEPHPYRLTRMIASGECPCTVIRGCGDMRYVNRAKFEGWVKDRERRRQAEASEIASAAQAARSGSRGVGYIDWEAARTGPDRLHAEEVAMLIRRWKGLPPGDRRVVAVLAVLLGCLVLQAAMLGFLLGMAT
eukprot:g14912.t1